MLSVLSCGASFDSLVKLVLKLIFLAFLSDACVVSLSYYNVARHLPTYRNDCNNCCFTSIMTHAYNAEDMQRGLLLLLFSPFTTKFKNCILPTSKERSITEVVRISNIMFHLSKLWKPSSPYCVMWYFWWGCRGNLELITPGSERFKVYNTVSAVAEENFRNSIEYFI